MAQNNRNLFAHSSRGQEFEIQMSMWLESLQRLPKESCMASPSFQGASGVFLGCITPIPTSVFMWPFPPRDCLFFFMRTLAVGFRSHPGIQEDLMSKLIYLIPAAKTLFFFPKRSHLQPLGLQCKNLLGSKNPATVSKAYFVFEPHFPT